MGILDGITGGMKSLGKIMSVNQPQWNAVLTNAHIQGIQSTSYPMFQQQGILQLQQQQMAKYSNQLYFDVKIKPQAVPSAPTHENWLHSRIERVRLRGREWLEGKRLLVTIDNSKSPPTVQGREEEWEGSGIPVKRLKNGDFVWTGQPPVDYTTKYQLTTTNATANGALSGTWGET